VQQGTYPHGLNQLVCVLLVLCHFLIPHYVELLELEHVGLLHAQPLGNLPRAHGLLSAVLLVQFELLQAVLRDLSLHILALPLAVLAVLFQDLQEVLDRRILAGITGHGLWQTSNEDVLNGQLSRRFRFCAPIPQPRFAAAFLRLCTDQQQRNRLAFLPSHGRIRVGCT
jgi:hypothetical protein